MDPIRIGEELKKARKNAGISAPDVGRLFKTPTQRGVSSQSIYAWEAGRCFPSREKWATLEIAYNKPSGWMFALQAGQGLQPEQERICVDSAVDVPVPAKTVPLISFVHAGGWSAAVDNFQPGDAEEWIRCASDVGPSAFALLLTGPSMEPEFNEGEIIIVDPDKRYESGDYVIAKNGQDEATFKKYVKDGNRHFLVPLNEKWGPPMEMTGKEWVIVGRVVEKQKKY